MYHDIAQEIIQEIISGHFDEKLPTEKELMAQYAASRNTIRKAIDVVFAHGLLRRVQGSGYYIIKQSTKGNAILNMSIGFDRSAMPAGGPLRSKVITLDEARATPALADQGNVAVGAALHRVVRLRYLQDQLYDLEVSYFPQQAVPVLTREAAEHSIFAFLRDTYQMSGSTTENYVSLATLTAPQAKLLEQPAGAAALCLEAINYLASGDVFNFSATYFAYPDFKLYYHTENIDLQ